MNSGSSESGAVITGTSVNDAISFAYSGINASYNNGDMSYNLCFDTVASTIATAPKVALYYDFDGDGSTDRTETAGYFALDPIADSWECWSSETSTYTVTGDDYQDFDNGSVTLLIWNALGDANTTEVKVNASTDASVIYIPYTESSTDDNATDEGTDEGTDESTEEGTDDTTESSGDWSLIWQDEFDTDEIDTSKWDLEENCWGGGNNEQQCYTDQESNAYIDDSILYITAINESYTGASANEDDASYDVNNTTTLPYTSARLRTKNLADFKYGRFEIPRQTAFRSGHLASHLDAANRLCLRYLGSLR